MLTDGTRRHVPKADSAALLRTLAEFALAQGAHRLHWEVLDWNQPAVKFYLALGAEIASHWWPCRMDRQAMEHFAHG